MRAGVRCAFLLLFAPAFFGGDLSLAQGTVTPLQRIVVLARDARLPLGIVLGEDGALCRNDLWAPPKGSEDPLGSISTIAGHYGYTLEQAVPAGAAQYQIYLAVYARWLSVPSRQTSRP